MDGWSISSPVPQLRDSFVTSIDSRIGIHTGETPELFMSIQFIVRTPPPTRIWKAKETCIVPLILLIYI
jgi:hypothetical protein